MRPLFLSIALLASLNILPHTSVSAGENLFIASASNFILPLEELTKAYNQTHDLSFTLSYGSSGKLYAQLLHGAPYDIFLSADKERPALLYKLGLCEAPFKYATGRVVLWSAGREERTGTPWQRVLIQSRGKIAISNTETAPYGEIPYRTLQQHDLLDTLQSRLIFGQTVGQTFLFTKSGAAPYGFIALSQALSPEGLKGHYWPMPESDPIEQWGCVPVSAKNIKESNRLQDFLMGQSAQAIIHNHGYR